MIFIQVHEIAMKVNMHQPSQRFKFLYFVITFCNEINLLNIFKEFMLQKKQYRNNIFLLFTCRFQDYVFHFIFLNRGAEYL